MEDEFDDELSIMDIYDIVTDFAKEFRPIIEICGAEPLSNVMSKVVTMLEQLEAKTVKIGHLQKSLQEKDAVIAKLERDKIEKAADRQRFEKELESIEEHWKDETNELLTLVNRLQDENKKLVKLVASKQDSSSVNSQKPLSPSELDISVLQKSRASVDKLRDQLKQKDRELSAKLIEIENMSEQIDKLSSSNKDLRKKSKLCQSQVKNLIDEKAEFLTQFQQYQTELNALRQKLGIAEKENEDLSQGRQEISSKNTVKSDNIKDILTERNELKARIRELEDELQLFRPKQTEMVSVSVEAGDDDTDDEDAPVQGPLPYEPSDAPWRKSDSGIRKLFRKIFNETNITMTFLGNSPKRSLSSLSKMTLVTANQGNDQHL